MTLRTARLLLRAWTDADLPAFAAMNADPRVMEFFPSTLTPAESAARAAHVRKEMATRGFGLWAAELVGVAPFIGFLGLAVPELATAFTPCVEIGWRLAHPFWGLGLATEGARVVARYGLEGLGLREIVSFTAEGNVRSRRVMERIGMSHDARDDFDHPGLPEHHPLRRHVLYRLDSVSASSLPTS